MTQTCHETPLKTEWDKLFIGGKWVEPSTAEVIEVHSPATGELVGKVPLAAQGRRRRRVRGRPQGLRRGPVAAHVARRSAPRCSAAAVKLHGGARRRAEVPAGRRDRPAADDRRHDAVRRRDVGVPVLRRRGRQVHLARLPRRRLRPDAWCVREPIGVVGAVTAWNVPFFLAANKLGPALLAGCTIVLKPAAETPLSLFAMAEIFAEAGLPEGVLSVVPGGPETGRALTANPEIDKFTFTGSVAVGKEIGKIAAEKLKPCTLELGGKSAAIILEDADLDSTLPMLVFSGLMNCGQACVGPDPHPGAAVALRRGRREAVGRRRRDAGRPARRRRRHDRPADLREAARARRGLHQEGRRGGRAARHRRRPARGPRQRLVRAADGVRRRRQLDDHRPGGDLRSGARGDPLRHRGRRGAHRQRLASTAWRAACAPPTTTRR